MRKYEPRNIDPVQFAPSKERLEFPYVTPRTDQLFYKFQPPTLNSLYTLAEKYFWFSSLEQLNDPHELRVDSEEEATDEEIIMWAKTLAEKGEYEAIGGIDNLEQIIKNTDDAIELTRDYWFRSLNLNLDLRNNKIKFFCVSETYVSPAMWAHYAQNHTGWVIAFKPMDILEGMPSNSWFKVIYQDSVPNFGLNDFFENMEWQRKLYATKSNDWKYEKEWRLLHSAEDQKWDFDVSCIDSIIFGKDCDKQTENLVISLTNSWNIEYYKAIPSQEKYEILKQPLNRHEIE